MHEAEIITGAIVMVTGLKPGGFHLYPNRRLIDRSAYGPSLDDPLEIGDCLRIVPPEVQWAHGECYVSVKRSHVEGINTSIVYHLDMLHCCSPLTEKLRIEHMLVMKERYPTAWTRILGDVE